MQTTSFSIPNISCGHCVMNIKRELGDLQGVSKVEGDPLTKQITVVWEPPASLEGIHAALKDIGYPATC